MKFSEFYSAPKAQPVQAGLAGGAGSNSTEKPSAPAPAANAVSVSWLGVLLALVALRLVYELSE